MDGLGFSTWNFVPTKRYRIYLENGQSVTGFYIGQQNVLRTSRMFTFYNEPHNFISVDDREIVPEQTILLMDFRADNADNLQRVQPFCSFLQGFVEGGQLIEHLLTRKPTLISDEEMLGRNEETLIKPRSALYSDAEAIKQSQIRQATSYLDRINEIRTRPSAAQMAPHKRWTAEDVIDIYNRGEIPPGVPAGEWTPQFMREHPDGIPNGLNVPNLASFIAKKQDEDDQTEQRKRPHTRPSSGNRLHDLPLHLQERIISYVPTRKHGPVRRPCNTSNCAVSGGTRRKRRRTRKHRIRPL